VARRLAKSVTSIDRAGWESVVEAWEREEPDPDWTENTIVYVQSVLDVVDGSADMVQNIECHQSACRIKVLNSRPDALHALQTLLRNDGMRYMYRLIFEDGGRVSGTTVFVFGPEPDGGRPVGQ
jgi:hypothetical protein